MCRRCFSPLHPGEREGGRERERERETPAFSFFFSLNARQRGDGANSLLSSALLADRRAAFCFRMCVFFFLFPYPIRSSDASTAANLRVLLLERSRTHSHTHTHTHGRAHTITHTRRLYPSLGANTVRSFQFCAPVAVCVCCWTTTSSTTWLTAALTDGGGLAAPLHSSSTSSWHAKCRNSQKKCLRCKHSTLIEETTVFFIVLHNSNKNILILLLCWSMWWQHGESFKGVSTRNRRRDGFGCSGADPGNFLRRGVNWTHGGDCQGAVHRAAVGVRPGERLLWGSVPKFASMAPNKDADFFFLFYIIKRELESSSVWRLDSDRKWTHWSPELGCSVWMSCFFFYKYTPRKWNWSWIPPAFTSNLIENQSTLKEQSAQNVKFSHCLLTSTLTETSGEVLSSTKHFWSLTVKHLSAKQVK